MTLRYSVMSIIRLVFVADITPALIG